MSLYTRTYLAPAPLGALIMESDGESLVGLRFSDENPPTPGAPAEEPDLPVFRQTAKWLDLYFAGKIPDFTPPIDLRTSPFCKEVCALLADIPYGQTATYGRIAKILAARRRIPRMSAQAVGGAVGRNPIAIILPCHRVIGAGGALVGYGGGLCRKEALLRLEKETLEKERKRANRTPEDL